MARVVRDQAVEPAVRVLLSAMDVDGGATAEQRAVLDALASGLWSDHDLDVSSLAPLEPTAARAALPDPEDRQRTVELLILFELCRHPLSPAQVARTEAYAAALDVSGHGLALVRDLVSQGVEAAAIDFQRYFDAKRPNLSEPTLRGTRDDAPEAADPELAQRLRALHDLPPGTLGHEYVEFYRRNQLTLPGDDPSSPAVFVSHDMCHVIGGYEPTGPGEIALGAMQLAITDNDAHWIQFLGNLGVHEAGYLGGHVVPKQATLARPGAAATLADALRRGEQCTGDFTAADHLAMVELPLSEVRARFGVPPLTV
jgi:hypothetical protein